MCHLQGLMHQQHRLVMCDLELDVDHGPGMPRVLDSNDECILTTRVRVTLDMPLELELDIGLYAGHLPRDRDGLS